MIFWLRGWLVVYSDSTLECPEDAFSWMPLVIPRDENRVIMQFPTAMVIPVCTLAMLHSHN